MLPRRLMMLVVLTALSAVGLPLALGAGDVAMDLVPVALVLLPLAFGRYFGAERLHRWAQARARLPRRRAAQRRRVPATRPASVGLWQRFAARVTPRRGPPSTAFAAV